LLLVLQPLLPLQLHFSSKRRSLVFGLLCLVR
jgi:hypothetical protein